MTINGVDISQKALRAAGYDSTAISIMSAAQTGSWADPRISLTLSSKTPHGGDISAASLYQSWRDLGLSDTNAIRAVFIALSESGLDGTAKNAYSGAAGLYQGLGYYKQFATVSSRLKDHIPMMKAMIKQYGLATREISLWSFYAMHAQGRFATWDNDVLNGMRGFVNKDRGTYDVGYGAQFSTTNGLSSCNDLGLLVLTAIIRGLNAAGLAETTSLLLRIPIDVKDFKRDDFFRYPGPYAPFKARKHLEPGQGTALASVHKKADAHSTAVSSQGDGLLASFYISTNTVDTRAQKPVDRNEKKKGRLLISSANQD